jgi:hypothetical protein
MMNIERLLSVPPKLHGPETAPTDGWRLDEAALLFLESRVRAEMRTIETGAGVTPSYLQSNTPVTPASSRIGALFGAFSITARRRVSHCAA